MKKIKCPICYNTNTLVNIIEHNCFMDYFYHKCDNCEHLFTDYSETFKSNTIFKTGKQRADDYVSYILKYFKFGSLLEIGSANDFYFLKKLNEYDNSKHLYLHDSFDYSDMVPDYINFLKLQDVKKLTKKIDICYMSHSLEHIPNIDEFLTLMVNIIDTFIIEIPILTNSTLYELEKRKNPHYHYYTKKSIETKFNQFKFNLTRSEFSKYTNKNMMFVFKKT